MKLPSNELRAKSIGDSSFELLNFNGLPHNASKERQIEALKQDERWQEEHHNMVSKRIDNLIQRIESGV